MRSRLRLAAAAILCALLPAGARAYEQELAKLSSEMAQNIKTAQKSTLAVVDFTDLQGNVTALGRFLAEEFSVALAGAGQGFQVVDRTHLTSILREHKLSETGLIDPSTARELGKITGVEALITGSLTPFGDSVRIAVKILDTESATIIGSATGNIPRTEAINDLLAIDIGGPGGSGSPVPPPPRPEIKAQQTVEVNKFSFALKGCSAAGSKISCDLVITNQGVDRELNIYKGSRIFDEYGNEYPATDSRLANKSVSYTRYANLRSRLISGIPTKAQISYGQSAEPSTLLTVMEIKIDGSIIQYRNVPVTR